MDRLIQMVNVTRDPIVLGDFNLPSINWETSTSTDTIPAQFLEACEEVNI